MQNTPPSHGQGISDSAKNEDEAALLEAEMFDIFQREGGMATEAATQLAKVTIMGLRRRLGAQRIYIPRPNRAERNAAILHEWNGRNTADVCRKYGVGRRWVYELARQKQAETRN